MLRRAWRPLAGTVLVVGASAALYRSFSRDPPVDAFTLRVRERDEQGKRITTTKSLPMLTMAEVNERLTRHATHQAIYRPGGIVWNSSTAQLPSNSPIEDAHAAAIVERDPLSSTPDGDFVFYSVMDGHGGPYTSRLLARILIPAVALQLKSLTSEPSSFIPKSTFLDNVKSFIGSRPPKSIPFDSDPRYVSLAIQTAFAMVDSEIVNAPLRIVQEHIETSKNKDPVPDLSRHPMALASMLPALSDTANRDLYIACTGDCRAVAGVWEEDESGHGSWKVQVLSEDQTGRNPSELQRIQSEHPEDEASSVVQRGRILGGLEPSRAFGDARYKWPSDLQKVLYKVFLEGNGRPMRQTPPELKTPPYVTAQPVITHHKLPSLGTSPDDSSSTQAKAKSQLRFIVLATDGLWDELSSTEVVQLVGGHLAKLSGWVPRAELNQRIPVQLSTDGVEGKDVETLRQKREGKRDGESAPAWAFVDDNVSTHLIRNAFGGADKNRLRKLLSIPAPMSRSYRDDVTVTVLWWEDGKEGQKNESSFVLPVQRHEKAKL